MGNGVSSLLQPGVGVGVTAGISAPAGPRFPELPAAGPTVDASRYIMPGTGWRVIVAGTFAVFLAIAFSVGTMGVGLVLLLLAPLIDLMLRRRILAQIKGTSLEVGPDQLAEVHDCVRTYSQRLGLKEVPLVYVIESNSLNAFAQRIGSRHVVHLIDDVVWGALKAGDPRALNFVIAHELAHHALGHTGGFRSYLSKIFPSLSRLDELSADGAAARLVGDRDAAFSGLLMLMVGPQLAPYVNRQALLKQAAEVAADKHTKKAERVHTHPFMARRIHELHQVRG